MARRDLQSRSRPSAFARVSPAARRCERRSLTEAFDAADRLVFVAKVEIVPVDIQQAFVAREAFRASGKGRLPAGLNFGGCFAYARARTLPEPLPSKGGDFGQTDLLLT